MKENEKMQNMTPDEIEAQIKAAEEAAKGNTEAKPKKVKKPRILKIKVTVPEGLKAGDEFEFDYEVPKGASRAGVNAGIPVEEMDETQLRIERRNAHSVWYKANKKDATSAGAQRAKERLDKVESIMAEKGIAVSVRKAVDVNTIADLIKSKAISLDELNALLNTEAPKKN